MPFAMTNQSGTLVASGPTDVCKTPTPAGTIPLPYPNIAMMTASDSGTLSAKVKISGSKAAHVKTKTKDSSGDEPGTAGGLASGKNRGPAGFLKGSMKVKVEGKSAVRLGDQTFHNGSPNNNTIGAAAAPSQNKVDIGG